MSSSIGNTFLGELAAGTSHSQALTLSAGTNRKVVFVVMYENTTTTWSDPAYNGVAADTVVARQTLTSVQAVMYKVDVPDGTVAGAYNITFTSSTSVSPALAAWEIGDVALGAAEDAYFDTDTSTTVVGEGTGSLDVSANAIVLSAVVNGASSGTWDSVTTVTKRGADVGAAADYAYGDVRDTSGGAGKTVQWTYSATANNKIMMAASFAEAAAAGGAPDRGMPRGLGRGLGRGLV